MIRFWTALLWCLSEKRYSLLKCWQKSNVLFVPDILARNFYFEGLQFSTMLQKMQWRPASLLKKKNPCEFGEIFYNTFLYNTSRWLLLMPVGNFPLWVVQTSKMERFAKITAFSRLLFSYNGHTPLGA